MARSKRPTPRAATLAWATTLLGSLAMAANQEATAPASSCGTAQWRLVYHHDARGGPVAGSKAALFDAVRRGQPLRLAWGFSREREGRTITLEHAAEPVFVSVMDGSELTVQLPEHVAQAAYHDPARATFDKGGVLWRGLLRTDGVFDAIMVDRATGEEVRRLPQRARVAWFTFGPDEACAAAPVALAVPQGVSLRDAADHPVAPKRVGAEWRR